MNTVEMRGLIVGAMKWQRLLIRGEKITVNQDLSLNVPNEPMIPFIEGDGIGVDMILMFSPHLQAMPSIPISFFMVVAETVSL